MRLSGAQSYFLEDSLQGPNRERSRRRQQAEFWDKLLIQDQVWFMHTFNRDGGRGKRSKSSAGGKGQRITEILAPAGAWRKPRLSQQFT